MGAYHSIDVELNKPFSLTKQLWDQIALSRVEDCCDVTKRAEVAALLIDEGLANLCLVTDAMTIVRAHITSSIPKKRKHALQGHDKAVEKFFSTVYEALSRHVDFEVVKCLIIAGPGFTKDQFLTFLTSKAVQKEDKKIIENKSKILIAFASSAHKPALKEVLQDKVVLEKMQDTKAAKEVQVLNKFYQTLSADPTRATYGYKQVLKANEQAAIEILMVSDDLFRSCNLSTRQNYVKLVESVKDNGGDVRIFSSLHVSGTQLAKLSGIAALLRFPMPGLDDSEDDSDEEKSNTEDEEKDNIYPPKDGDDDDVYYDDNNDDDDDDEPKSLNSST
eukprot:TRINITY_DN1957_c2_g1_i5.p1 TRINITY_DN1957_c2_g1~~TRINITY_DN1957_c2_g1_i5.p1  ORF type:complete len:333 (-),score=104.88 TRINITY_DN1957_c2_g1_i5:61-1059(-)